MFFFILLWQEKTLCTHKKLLNAYMPQLIFNMWQHWLLWTPHLLSSSLSLSLYAAKMCPRPVVWLKIMFSFIHISCEPYTIFYYLFHFCCCCCLAIAVAAQCSPNMHWKLMFLSIYACSETNKKHDKVISYSLKVAEG